MSQHLIIWLHGEGHATHWAQVSAGTVDGPYEIRGAEDDLAKHAKEAHRVWALVPTQKVLVSGVQLPQTTGARLLKAVPFALEDQLADDVDSYHFAIGEKLPGGQHQVAAVAHADMRAWQEELDRLGVGADFLVSEGLLLPVENDAISILVAEDTAVLRTAADRIFALDFAEVGLVLELEGGEQQHHVYGDASRVPDLGRADKITPVRDWRSWLAQQAPAAPSLNLLSGDYVSKRADGSTAWKVFTWAAVAAAIAVGIGVTASYIEAQRLTRQLDEINQSSQQVLLRVAPNTQRIVDARQQMEMLLEQKTGAASGGGLLDLLVAIGPNISADKQLEIRSMQYRDNTLLLQLHAPALPNVERIRQSIDRKSGITASLESSNRTDNGISVRIRVSRSA